MRETQKEIKLRPEVFKAIREASGYSPEEIAKKLKTSADKVISVEEGHASFTLTQIKKLAEIYKRPLVAFFHLLFLSCLNRLTTELIERED